ncbi:hypothetical protein NVIRPANT_00816 [Pantoea sp. Nvir]|nr:hypothetical protein NVIRPANT_00816 [Pantoea sp. Nvir]
MFHNCEDTQLNKVTCCIIYIESFMNERDSVTYSNVLKVLANHLVYREI